MPYTLSFIHIRINISFQVFLKGLNLLEVCRCREPNWPEQVTEYEPAILDIYDNDTLRNEIENDPDNYYRKRNEIYQRSD